jgi:hypothetical protein
MLGLPALVIQVIVPMVQAALRLRWDNGEMEKLALPAPTNLPTPPIQVTVARLITAHLRVTADTAITAALM